MHKTRKNAAGWHRTAGTASRRPSVLLDQRLDHFQLGIYMSQWSNKFRYLGGEHSVVLQFQLSSEPFYAPATKDSVVESVVVLVKDENDITAETGQFIRSEFVGKTVLQIFGKHYRSALQRTPDKDPAFYFYKLSP